MDQTAQIISDLKAKIEKTIKHVKDQLGGIRTGRASPMLVDTIRVDYYGAMTPLHGMAHISVPDARQLLIKPFDVSAMKEIERAILKSDLGLSPQSDGKVLRLIMPPLSTEQRQKLAVKVKDLVEQNRVALRNERRDANKHGEQAKKDSLLTEDQVKKLHEKVDQEIKGGEGKLEDLLKLKTKEIMEG
ncbi:ribosome-recycling factor [Planctomycetota bacterium]|jgi:ribosome recycling factor|nr:ribosome recycling factor [Planctomycetota bacterium]MSR37465.1 ribosome recycling factor [Planctomycetota bacterium]GDY02827.1 ribosome-recycling factor [Planctomycetota bacterium]